MTDPFDSLRPPRRPLPMGGDDRAVTRGRRLIHRRRVAYGGVVSAGLVAVGAVVVLDGRRDNQHDSVGVLDPDPSSTPSASPSAAGPSPSGVPGPLPTLITTTDLLPPPIGGSSPEPTASPEQGPTPAPRGPYVGPEPVAADGGAIVTRTVTTDRTFCAAGAQQQVSAYTGWCSAVTGASEVVAGHSTPYSYKLCRRVDQGDGTLDFETRKEADFSVVQWDARSDSSTPLWQAGAGATLPSQPHSLIVTAGDCVTWTTTWGGQDNDGYAASDDGGQELDAAPWATEFIGDDADYAAPVAFKSVSVRWS